MSGNTQTILQSFILSVDNMFNLKIFEYIFQRFFAFLIF